MSESPVAYRLLPSAFSEILYSFKSDRHRYPPPPLPLHRRSQRFHLPPSTPSTTLSHHVGTKSPDQILPARV